MDCHFYIKYTYRSFKLAVLQLAVGKSQLACRFPISIRSIVYRHYLYILYIK